MKQFFPLAAAALVVAAAVGLAFTVTGSPAHQRELAFDRARVESLEAMSSQIELRYRDASLPVHLPADLVKNDPKTGMPLEYRRVSNSTYHICAVFAFATEGQSPYDSWRHRAGQTCFTRRLTHAPF